MKGAHSAYHTGRKQRLRAELLDERAHVGLYSHNPTWQSAYEQGWHSVTPWDIHHAKQQASSPLHGLERAKALFVRYP